MKSDSQDKKSKDAQVKKQNQDLPNIPASSEKIKSGNMADKQITETSKLQKEGKTDNTEKNPKK